MPQIKRPERKKKKNSKRSNDSIIFYSDIRWKRLREWYIREHPICERCFEQGISTPATEIHHVVPFGSAKTTEDKFDLLLDTNNLMSLCSKCHHEIHNEMRAKKKKENEKQSLYYISGK